jgi:hypothetical protein
MINDNDFAKPKINDSVKITNIDVNNGHERFWVTLERIIDNKCQGIVDNDLIDKSKYDFGSKIDFSLNDILSIYPHIENENDQK